MKVILLGTAAGGGFPQWNCACRLCRASRLGLPNVPPRTQDCVAVSATGQHWYLVNVSPDIRTQLLRTPSLAPGPGPRDTPLRGALLSDAELDHTAGLLLLREGGDFRVLAPKAVLGALRDRFPVHDIVAGYHEWDWSVVAEQLDFDGLRCVVFPLHDKPPRYAAGAAGPWAVAYRIEDPHTGGALVYAPCLGTWPAGFDEFVTGASCVLLDGTFHTQDEMAGAAGDRDPAHQRTMGHLPISGPDGSLAMVRRHPGIRWVYTHLNNTNPLLDSRSPRWAELRAAGAEVLSDGAHLDI